MRRPIRALAALSLALSLSACAHAQDGAGGRVVLADASYPEGPLWHGGRLYVAEMGGERIRVLRGTRAATFWRAPEGCGPTALAPYGDGFVVLCHRTAALAIIDAQGRLVRRIEHSSDGVRFQNPNDASADDRGGVYFSDPGPFTRDVGPRGIVYRLDTDGRIERVIDGLWYANGVFFERGARRLYVSDMFRHRVLRYGVAADGALRVEAPIDVSESAAPWPEGVPRYAEWGPDGLEVGPDGDLYVAIYGQGRVLRIGQYGAIKGALTSPARFTTNIAFDGAGRAYTTASYQNLEWPYPGEVRAWPQPALVGGPDAP
ncbi:MAG: hypothetical protein GC206_09805 [Alphaproteobacteria bacterium]|nr:hypothetical protein [Alphaproteobacteria bacterium]